jgi:tRNA uridine 5-carbamoylmethylation protein Kti12
MKFPIKWSIPKNIVDEGQVIAFEVEDQNTKGITFICPINEKEVSSILVKIGKTIKLNKERELKERLFKQTVEQLKQTFEKTDLDKLQNLYFDFDEGELDTDLDGEIETKLEDEQNGQESTVVELVQQ